MSSGFITEREVVEVRRKKQEEWERVRKAEDPLERPEETHEHRSLFERLQEQKQKRDLEYEEAHKLKNMIKGLDDDEIEFLDLVDRTKLAADRKKTIEEELELNDYRNRVASLQEKSLDQKLHSEINTVKPKVVVNNKTSQTKLLKGVLIKKPENRKRTHSEMENIENENKSKTCHNNSLKNTEDINQECNKDENVNKSEDPHCKGDTGNDDNSKERHNKTSNVGMRCIGILPGLGCYEDSSSDESSESDREVIIKDDIKLDLLGRKITKKES